MSPLRNEIIQIPEKKRLKDLFKIQLKPKFLPTF